jgi:hypothetical protein
MKSTNVVLAVIAAVASVAAIVFGVLYFTKDSDGQPTAARAECGDRIFGHISSLTPEGKQYVLHFDPAWFTSGVTANKAAEEDGVVAPGEPVPNDNYVVDEGHRLLTYLVPDNAAVTVLTRKSDNFYSTPITVSQLAQLVDGRRPVELFEPLDSGVWIRVHIDTVCALDQQYRP